MSSRGEVQEAQWRYWTFVGSIAARIFVEETSSALPPVTRPQERFEACLATAEAEVAVLLRALAQPSQGVIIR